MIIRGWYSDGTEVRPDDALAHFSVAEFQERPKRTQREPMDMTAWCGLVTLVSCIVTVIGCSM